MDPERLTEVMRQPPAVHRFPASMAGRVQALCAALVEEYGGDAEALWTRGEPDGHDVLELAQGARDETRGEGGGEEEVGRPLTRAPGR